MILSQVLETESLKIFPYFLSTAADHICLQYLELLNTFELSFFFFLINNYQVTFQFVALYVVQN